MAEFREDVTAYPLVMSLLECYRDEFVASGLNVPGFLSPVVGAEIPLDYVGGDSCDDCSQGWVRVSSIFPSIDFPNADNSQLNNSTKLAIEIEMGIARPIDGLDEKGDPPTVAEYTAGFREQMADMAALKRALCKCLKAAGHDFLLTGYTPAGPLGLVVGGAWTALVRFPAAP